jgi:hypothetical protein
LVLANLAWSVATLPCGLSRKEERSASSYITSVFLHVWLISNIILKVKIVVPLRKFA